MKNGNGWRNAFITAVITVAVGAFVTMLLGYPLLKEKIERMDEVHKEILERLKALERIVGRR